MATLFYVYDPMCSWCYGYQPSWDKIEQALTPYLTIKKVLGGLAPDSDVPMPQDMQLFLQKTWQKISQQLGSEFNFDFWRQCTPKRSTYPACRAILIARAHGKEAQMNQLIQHAYYQNAQNPSEHTTLNDLLIQLDIEDGHSQLFSDKVNGVLMQEIAFAHTLPIQGYPSLVLEMNGQVMAIPVNYKEWQETVDLVLAKIHS